MLGAYGCKGSFKASIHKGSFKALPRSKGLGLEDLGAGI